jgi:hypothetical protein
MFSFQLALLEWSDAIHDLITVSIHTYERAPQLVRNIHLKTIIVYLLIF